MLQIFSAAKITPSKQTTTPPKITWNFTSFADEKHRQAGPSLWGHPKLCQQFTDRASTYSTSNFRVHNLRKQGCYLKFWKTSNASWGITSRATHHRASWSVNTRWLKLNSRPHWQAAAWGTWSHSVVKLPKGLSLLSGDQWQEGMAWSFVRGSVGWI